LSSTDHHGVCPVEENVYSLRRGYCDALLRLAPLSVLDVGCGGGQVIEMLIANGVCCTGTEVVPTAWIGALGNVSVVQAEAESLPFADRSFDWVSMRHVPHHLADPQAAFGEALRVSRKGLLLAEPYFDRNDPAQALAEDVDLWFKTQHRRAGRIHQPNLDQADVNRLLQPLGVQVHASEKLSPLACRDGASLSRDLQSQVSTLAVNDPQFEARLKLLERLAVHPVSWNGSWLMAIQS